MENCLSSMSASILVAYIAVNCIFSLGGVTLGQSGWSVSKYIGLHVLGKVVHVMQCYFQISPGVFPPQNPKSPEKHLK